MASVGDAVGAGYVASLARPGGNITGLTLFATDQSAKRLQLIKQISPGIVRIAVIWNGNASGHRLQIKEMEQAVSAMGIVLQSLPISNANGLDPALRATAQEDAQAIVTMDDPLVQSQRVRIVEFARGTERTCGRGVSANYRSWGADELRPKPDRHVAEGGVRAHRSRYWPRAQRCFPSNTSAL